MDLYCLHDAVSGSRKHPGYPCASANFSGRTQDACVREAKKLGWKFITQDGHRDVLCPPCAKE